MDVPAKPQLLAQRAHHRALERANHLGNAASLARSAMHEIKNDLGPLVGYLSILEFSNQPNPAIFAKMQDSIRRVQAQLDRMSGPLRRPAETKMELFCLPTLIVDCIDRTRAMGLFRRIDVQCRLPPRDARYLATVHGSRDAMDQVLHNLISNAVDALASPLSGQKSRGSIWIELDSDEESVTMSVKDSGTGIPLSLQERVFEPFFSTKPESGGGLGLCIARSIVEGSGGSLTLHSQEDCGTVVKVQLPRARTRSNKDLSPLTLCPPQTSA